MKRYLYIALLASALMPAAALAAGNTSNTTGMNSNAMATSTMYQNQNLNRTDIMRIQEALNDQGFYKGQNDGVWGPNTANALRQFQSQNQLPGNGSLNTQTLDQLGVTLSMNDTAGVGTDNTTGTNGSPAAGSTMNSGTNGYGTSGEMGGNSTTGTGSASGSNSMGGSSYDTNDTSGSSGSGM